MEGRSCIVTGAGTGIGPALATGLARAGAAVVLTGRRQSVLEAAVRQIQAQLDVDDENDTKSRRVFASPCDITQFDQIADLVADTEYLTGIPPTILINNAGTNALQKAENLTSEHWHTALELMLTAPFMLTRAMSDHMKVERYGRVINLASLQSFVAFPDSIPYAAAKTGVLGLTRSLAEVYSAIHGYDNVTCNAITPGYVQTDLTQSVFANVDQSERLASATILGRNSVPDDLTGAVVFLSSPAASYVTGQTLVVDGGFTTLGMRW